MTPTRRLAILFSGAAFLFMVSTPLALSADLLLIGLALWDWRRTSPIDTPRRQPERLSLGQTGDVAFEIENSDDRPASIRLTDDLSAGLKREGPFEVPPLRWTETHRGTAANPVRWKRKSEEDGEAELELTLPPRQMVEVRYSLRAIGRGHQHCGSIHLRVRSPWGLMWRQFEEPRVDPIRVQPGSQEHKKYRVLSLRHRLQEAGLHQIRERGAGQSFESLREYASGDDPRKIDWKVTAKRAQVIVREYETERSQNVLIAIDSGRLMTEQIGDRARVDYALSAALLLTDVARSFGDRVGVLVFDDRVRQFMNPSRVRVARIADALTNVEPRMVEPNYPLAFTFLGHHLKRRSLIVLFTDLIDAHASRALVAQMTRSARAHLPLAVTLRNPGLLETAAQACENPDEVYRRAAAEELIHARALALNTMRRSGVLVLDSSPQDAIPETANRYMDVKRRGLL